MEIKEFKGLLRELSRDFFENFSFIYLINSKKISDLEIHLRSIHTYLASISNPEALNRFKPVWKRRVLEKLWNNSCVCMMCVLIWFKLSFLLLDLTLRETEIIQILILLFFKILLKGGIFFIQTHIREKSETKAGRSNHWIKTI